MGPSKWGGSFVHPKSTSFFGRFWPHPPVLLVAWTPRVDGRKQGGPHRPVIHGDTVANQLSLVSLSHHLRLV